MNLIASISTLCISTILLTSCGDSEFSRLAPKEKLPSEFKEYQFIDNISAFEGGHTIEKFKYSAPGRMRYSINKNEDNIIIEVTSIIDDKTKKFSFYKLNALGEIIDDNDFIQSAVVAEHTGTEVLVGGSFLVNKERTYYTSWPLDGDKTRKQFTPINKDLTWSSEQVDVHYASIFEKAARIDSFIELEAVNSHEKKTRTRVVYYLNATGKWYVLFGNSLRSRYTGKELRAGENVILKDFGGQRMYEEYLPPSTITIPYFEKLTYSKTVSAGGGSTNSGPSASYYLEGVGYYQVDVNGSVLRFKKSNMLLRKDFGTQLFPPKESLLSGFAYYTNPKLKFSLLLVDRELYLIKNLSQKELSDKK